MALFQPVYAIHTDVFETVMQLAAAAYVAAAISSALVATRYIAGQLPLVCLSLLTAFVSSYWLVPEYGLWGASMSLLLSKLSFIAVGTAILFRAMRQFRPPETSFAPPESPCLPRTAWCVESPDFVGAVGGLSRTPLSPTPTKS